MKVMKLANIKKMSYLRDVGAEVSVDATALDTHHHSQVDTGPLRLIISTVHTLVVTKTRIKNTGQQWSVWTLRHNSSYNIVSTILMSTWSIDFISSLILLTQVSLCDSVWQEKIHRTWLEETTSKYFLFSSQILSSKYLTVAVFNFTDFPLSSSK